MIKSCKLSCFEVIDSNPLLDHCMAEFLFMLSRNNSFVSGWYNVADKSFLCDHACQLAMIQ